MKRSVFSLVVMALGAALLTGCQIGNDDNNNYYYDNYDHDYHF